MTWHVAAKKQSWKKLGFRFFRQVLRFQITIKYEMKYDLNKISQKKQKAQILDFWLFKVFLVKKSLKTEVFSKPFSSPVKNAMVHNSGMQGLLVKDKTYQWSARLYYAM